MVKPPESPEKFSSFLEIVKALRGPEGCPWDKEQTHRTLAPYAIEESFEMAEAIENGDDQELIGELGDVLLQVVLHAEIARGEGRFTIDDVVRAISEKMVRRHPHVFADEKVSDSKHVLQNWSEIKAKEKALKPKKPSSGFDIPVALPALSRAHKIGDKTQKQKFDWPNAEEVFKKVHEEIGELEAELRKSPHDSLAIEHELGDVLFSTAQLARHLGFEAEQCLRIANARFENRYFKMRQAVEASGRDWTKLSDEEKERAWVEVKKLECQRP